MIRHGSLLSVTTSCKCNVDICLSHIDTVTMLCFFSSRASLFVIGLDRPAFVLLCIVWLFFGCQYQGNRLPGKTRSQNDLLCVEWDVKLYYTQSLTVFSYGYSSVSEQPYSRVHIHAYMQII